MSGTGPSPRKMSKTEQESYGSDEEAEEFTDDTQKALEEVDLCQTEIDILNEKASNEILSVELTFTNLRKPYFDKRSVSIEKIPNFWVTTMMNHPHISALVDEDEEDCLHFMNKLEVEESEDLKSGYRIIFFFDKNPFFENDVLVKEFNLQGTGGNPVSTSSVIKWKKDMDLSKRQRKTVPFVGKRNVEVKTFFSWFNDNKDPTTDDIAEIIKDELWSNPLHYYLVPEGSVESVDEEGSEEGEEEDDNVVVDEEEEDQANDQEDEDQEKTAPGADVGGEETLQQEEEEEQA